MMLRQVFVFTLIIPLILSDENVNLPNNQNNLAVEEEIKRRINQLFIIPPNDQPSLDESDLPVDKPCAGGGICVPHHLCLDNNINIGGEGVIMGRFNVNIEEENECHYMTTCCDQNEIIDNPNIQVPNKFKGCGHRQVNGSLYSISESHNEAQYAEFPWMVAIMKEVSINDQTFFGYECGGSLIHPEVVVTAAHCVVQKRIMNLKIRAGEWDVKTTTEIWPYQDRTISQIIIHDEFYKGTLYNDIALLFLHERVDFAPNVQTICIPPVNMKFDRNECIATGWGKNVFGIEGKYQAILKKITLPIVPRNVCQTALRSTRLTHHFVLHESFICAGGVAGVDTCVGDGGSPLVCPIAGNLNRYYQAGIVAWGIDCGLEQTPGVYVDISGFRPWIDQQFELKGLDVAYYTP